MSFETDVCFSDQLAIEPLLANTGFVSCNEQDRLALRIESKSNSPYTISHAEPQFLHVWESGVSQSVHIWPAQLRPKLFQEFSPDKNLIMHINAQFVELTFELIADLDNPAHNPNMKYRPL